MLREGEQQPHSLPVDHRKKNGLNLEPQGPKAAIFSTAPSCYQREGHTHVAEPSEKQEKICPQEIRKEN